VINGVISVPIMAVMMRLASHSELMAGHAIGPRLRVLGWCATGVMALTVVALGVSMLT